MMNTKTKILPIGIIVGALIFYTLLRSVSNTTTTTLEAPKLNHPNASTSIGPLPNTPVRGLSHNVAESDGAAIPRRANHETGEVIMIDEDVDIVGDPLGQLKELFPALKPDIEQYQNDIDAQNAIIDSYEAKISERDKQLIEGGSATSTEYELSLERQAILESAKRLGQVGMILNAKIREYAQSHQKN